MNMMKVFLWGAGLALLSGCATTGSVSAPVAPENMEQAAAPAIAEMRHLNIKITATGSSEEGQAVADQLSGRVQEKLAAEGLVVQPNQADLELIFDVNAAEFDRSGNYYVYDANLKASAGITYGTSRPIGSKTFTVQSDRGLGKEVTLRSAAEKLADSAVSWAIEVVDPARCGLLANDITIYRIRGNQGDYARDFIRKINAVDGVLTCRVVAQDVEAQMIVFRVVYLRDSFPAGLMNYLSSKDKFNIKPK